MLKVYGESLESLVERCVREDLDAWCAHVVAWAEAQAPETARMTRAGTDRCASMERSLHAARAALALAGEEKVRTVLREGGTAFEAIQNHFEAFSMLDTLPHDGYRRLGTIFFTVEGGLEVPTGYSAPTNPFPLDAPPVRRRPLVRAVTVERAREIAAEVAPTITVERDGWLFIPDQVFAKPDLRSEEALKAQMIRLAA